MKLACAVGLALTLLVLPAAGADTPRKYAVVSLIGDALTLVTHRPSVGTIVDPNIRDSVALADPVFDDAVLLATEAALRRAAPGAPTALLSASGPATYADARRWLSERKFIAPKWLADALTAERATHLLLVTKHRAEARFQFASEVGGAGSLEGLGFYIDRLRPTLRQDTGARGIGFLGPYAYFEMSLIDLSSSTLLRQHRATASHSISAAESSGGASPWDVMSNSEKISLLKQLIGGEIEKSLPALLKAP